MCCIVLQCVAVCCSVMQCDAVCCSVLQCVAAGCSVLQCVAVCVLQYGGLVVMCCGHVVCGFLVLIQMHRLCFPDCFIELSSWEGERRGME